MRASARGYKAEHSQSGEALIQDGPYTLVRNPMYLGILLIGIGIILMLFNWWMVVIFLFVFTIRYLLLIFKEEKKLLIAFPQVYQDYCKQVPRILPKIVTISEKEISEYLPLKLTWLKKEIGSILTVLLAVLFVESWEDIKNEGVGIFLGGTLAIVITVLLFIVLAIYLNRRAVDYIKDVSNQSKTTS